MVHHSSIDRIWKIWVELQKIRKKPYAFATCARRSLFKDMEPFSYESINVDPLTKANSKPVQAFDPYKFNYWYDDLNLNGHTVGQINGMIKQMQSSSRIFAGFVLSGIQTSATVNVDVMSASGGSKVNVGSFYILGGPNELPWAYERIYKLDMTDAASKLGLSAADPFKFNITVTSYNGDPMPDVKFPSPLIVKRSANSDNDVIVIPLTKENTLPPKIVVKKGTQIVFHATEDGVVGPLRELGSYTNVVRCVIPPGAAGAYDLDVAYTMTSGDFYFTSNDAAECLGGSRLQISVDDDW
jgi:hypothetical protein